MTTETTVLPSLDEIRAMLAKLSASGVDVKKLAKESETDKPTLQSITFDAIVAGALAGNTMTDSVTKAVTAKAREVGLLKDNEEAKAANVQTLIRYAGAYDAAMVRAGYEWSKKVDTAPSDTPPEPQPDDVVSGAYVQARGKDKK